MESRITIEINFDEQNRPVLQIVARKSDDTRDRILHAFLESLGENGNWLHISLVESTDDYTRKRYLVRAITPTELKEEYKIIGQVIG